MQTCHNPTILIFPNEHLPPMDVLCSFCRTIPVVHKRAMTSWNLKSLLAVNSKRPPCLTIHAFKEFSRRKTSCCRGATLGTSFLFLVLMVCNLRQDTFIDYLISECGLGQITASLMIFFCAALGRTLLLIILLPLLDFTFFMLCSLG
jgi:hypothetical protein